MRKEIKVKVVAVVTSLVKVWKHVVGKDDSLQTDRCLKDFKVKKVALSNIVAKGNKAIPEMQLDKDEALLSTREKVGKIHKAYDAKIAKLDAERFAKTRKIWDANKKETRELNRLIRRTREDVNKAKGALEIFDSIC